MATTTKRPPTPATTSTPARRGDKHSQRTHLHTRVIITLLTRARRVQAKLKESAENKVAAAREREEKEAEVSPQHVLQRRVRPVLGSLVATQEERKDAATRRQARKKKGSECLWVLGCRRTNEVFDRANPSGYLQVVQRDEEVIGVVG